MRTLWHAFDGLPIWPRLSLLGILLGIIAGAATGALYVVAMITWSAFDDWQDLSYLAGALFIYGCTALVVGGVIGSVLGGLTGMLAGAALMGLLRVGVGDAVAAWTAWSVVVLIQVGLGLAIATPTWWWLSLIAPVISAAPMALAVRATAKGWSVRHAVPAGRA